MKPPRAGRKLAELPASEDVAAREVNKTHNGPVAPVGAPPRRRDSQPSKDTDPNEGMGDWDLPPTQLVSRGHFFVATHLMMLLAKGRKDMARDALLDQVSTLVLGLDSALAKKVLLAMADCGPIVDVYPLEVLAQVVERRPGWLSSVRFEPFIINKGSLEGRTFDVDATLELKLPLAVKVKAFALEGGGSPGYCFAPGPPGSYALEVGEPGTFSLLLRGERHRKHLIDRCRIRVSEEGPGSA